MGLKACGYFGIVCSLISAGVLGAALGTDKWLIFSDSTRGLYSLCISDTCQKPGKYSKFKTIFLPFLDNLQDCLLKRIDKCWEY